MSESKADAPAETKPVETTPAAVEGESVTQKPATEAPEAETPVAVADGVAPSGETKPAGGEEGSWFPKAITGFLNSVTAENPAPAEGVDVDTDTVETAQFGEEMQKTAEMMAKDIESVSIDVSKNVARVGEEIGKGWAGLNKLIDGVLSESATNKSTSERFQDAFSFQFPDLSGKEEVVDGFRCTLVQKYRSYHNNATPEKTYTWDGNLFVTVNRAAFWAEEDEAGFGRADFPVVLDFKEVEKVQKGQPGTLRLLLKSKASFIFNCFESETDYTNAISLLEHMSGSASATPKPEGATEGATTTDESAKETTETTPMMSETTAAAETTKQG